MSRPNSAWSFLLLIVLTAIITITPATAFGQFFSNFFDGGDEQPSHSGQASQDGSNGVQPSCKSYICPQAAHCVPEPSACPCSNPLQVKCRIGDWYACVRPNISCEDLVGSRGGGHEEL